MARGGPTTTSDDEESDGDCIVIGTPLDVGGRRGRGGNRGGKAGPPPPPAAPWRQEAVDSQGRRQIVDGEGVVGQQPRLEPGESFRYSSGAPLAAPSGLMGGNYTMISETGEELAARIPTFSLDSPYEQSRPS